MKRWLAAAAVLTLLVSIFVFLQAQAANPLVRIGIRGQWTWRYDHSPYADRGLFCLVPAILLGVLCHRTRERLFELQGGRLTWFLCLAVGLCFALQASFAYLSRSGFGQGVFWMGTPKANVDFAEACKTNTVAQVLREAQDPNRPFRIHLSTHPPGPVLFYLFQKLAWENAPEAAASFARLAERALPYSSESRKELESSVLSRPLSDAELATLYSSMFLLWLLVAAGLVPLYFWAASLFEPSVAVAAVGLYSLTPSFLLFNPMTDQLYAPLGMAILAAYHLGLSRRDPAQLIFAGLLTWVALQFTLAFLVLLFLFGLYIGLEMIQEGRARETAKLLAWPAGAFVALTLLGLPARYDCLSVWKLCMAHNAAFNTGRTYAAWVAFNPLDFALFVGLPVAVFFVRSAARDLFSRGADAARRFILALAATLLLLDLSGTNRGEVARLWMFLMPMTAAVAAHAMDDTRDESEPPENRVFAVCFALLFVQSLLFKLSFDLILPSL